MPDLRMSTLCIKNIGLCLSDVSTRSIRFIRQRREWSTSARDCTEVDGEIAQLRSKRRRQLPRQSGKEHLRHAGRPNYPLSPHPSIGLLNQRFALVAAKE